MNNHPLEIIFQQSNKSLINIRETVRFFDSYAFKGNDRMHVTTPSSVECIDDKFLNECINLRVMSLESQLKTQENCNHDIQRFKNQTLLCSSSC